MHMCASWLSLHVAMQLCHLYTFLLFIMYLCPYVWWKLPYKRDTVACQKFWKEASNWRCTKILSCWNSLNFFHPNYAIELKVSCFSNIYHYAVLSISFEVDVPTGFLSAKGASFLGGSGGMPLPPRKFWNLDAWKSFFHRFPDSIWALRTIKTNYVYYNRPFPKISITGL